MNIDGHPTVDVMRTYTPLTLLALAGMTDTRRAVHVRLMQPTCDATPHGNHPLSTGSMSLQYKSIDAPAKTVRIVSVVCVACGRFGNTEARNVPGSTDVNVQ